MDRGRSREKGQTVKIGAAQKGKTDDPSACDQENGNYTDKSERKGRIREKRRSKEADEVISAPALVKCLENHQAVKLS